MKYKCLASVILLLSGAPAFAGDVRLSGYGRFGLDSGYPNAFSPDQDPGLQAGMASPNSTGESLVDWSEPGFNLEFGSFLEYNAYTASNFSFAGIQADISYGVSMGNALWSFGANVIGQKLSNGNGFALVYPYASAQWGNSFVNLGYIAPANAFITPNFSDGTFFYSYADDMLQSELGILAGTEINNRFLIVASLNQNQVARLAGKARINDAYSVIGGAIVDLRRGGAYGFVGATADFERTRAQGLFTFYSGGFFAQAQIDYLVTDRLTATAYAQANQYSASYFLSGTYRVLTDFGSGANVDLFAGFGSNKRVSAGVRVIY